jgi:7 transmembrane receptor (rhodopsin family)
MNIAVCYLTKHFSHILLQKLKGKCSSRHQTYLQTVHSSLNKIEFYCEHVCCNTIIIMLICRYYAIIHPLRARHIHTVKRALVLISIFWMTSLVLVIPQLFLQRLDPKLKFPTPDDKRDDHNGDFSELEPLRVQVVYVRNSCLLPVQPVVELLYATCEASCIATYAAASMYCEIRTVCW